MKTLKRIAVCMAFSMTALILLAAPAGASSGLPGSGWWTGITIQNVGTATATVDVTAYDSASSSTYTYSPSVGAGASTTVLPTNFPGMPSGFNGSAIVSAAEPIRSIINVTNRYLSAQGLGDPAATYPAAGQYQGVLSSDTTISFPLAKNNHYNKTTTFYIQNVGSGAATATATFIFPSGTYTYTTPSIGAGQQVAVVPADSRDVGLNPPPSGNGVVGSLTVTSTQQLAGVVLEHKTTENPATLVQATRAFTPTEYNTTVFAPNNKNSYYGRFTGMQIQNVSGGLINVNVTYTALFNASTGCPGGTFTDGTTNLAVKASFTFPSSVLPSGCVASAVIVGTGNIVGQVNESFTSAYLAANPSRMQESTIYSTFASPLATGKVSIPVFKEDSYNKSTGVTIQNVGAGATNVVIVFAGPAGTFTSQPQAIPLGGSIIVMDARKKSADFWNGTQMTPAALGCTGVGLEDGNICGANGTMALIVTSPDQPIVAIANESTYPNLAPRMNQDKNNYEGFNLTP